MSNQFSTEISKALNSLFEGIVIINPEGEILWANNKSIEIFLAKSTNDLIGQSVGQYFHDLYKMQIIKAADNLINNKLKSFEKEVVLQINKEEFVPCKLKLEKFDDESLIIYLLNLSTEKKIEERLFETTEQINAIIKTAVDGIITIDQKGLIETVNPAKIPFIFLTAKVDKEDIRRGMNMGADDYLTKPFSDVELMDAVEVRLKKAEILKREYSKGFEGVKEFFTDAMEYKELKDLSAEKDLKIYNKKDIVFREGSYPVGIYYLNKGKVKTFMTNDDAKDYITGLYKEGEFFGYSTILENKPYTESAMTLEESEVCLIPKEEFFNLLYTNKDVAKKFIAMLSNNLLAIEERLIDLAYNSVRKRVAQSLVLLKERYEKENQEDYFNISISREDLANIVGTSKESVIRTLSDFKEEGLVEIKGSNIKIVNWEKLDRMKN